MKDFNAWLESGMKGPPPAEPTPGMSGLGKGRTGTFDTNLTPGNYGLICYVPDAKDGTVTPLPIRVPGWGVDETPLALEPADGGFKITSIDLKTEADVPGIDEPKFREQAELAKKNCPVSVALAATQINLDAKLL